MSWCYAPLARYIPAEHPLYGLQARGLDGTSQPARSIQDMAAEYIEQIRAVQESGPYHLLGWSFGGIVAQEIAVQLRAAGEQIAVLAIMDAHPPVAGDPPAPGDPARQDVAPHDIELPDLTEEVRQQYGASSEVISDEDIQTAGRVFQNNVRIMHSHECRIFAGDLLLIVSTGGRPDEISPVAAWTPYVSGDISEFGLPCKHHQMMQPDMLAQAWVAISTWLEQER